METPRRTPLILLLAVLGAASSAPAQEESSAAERLGVRPGSHHLSFFGGWHFGETARDADIIAPPLSIDAVRLRIDVENDPVFGLRYGYQVNDRWLIEGSLSRTSTELANKDTFDEQAARDILGRSEFSAAEVNDLIARLQEHSGPYDFDVTYFDLGAVYVTRPVGRWSFEVGGGIGWATGSLDEEPAVFEELGSSFCDPEDEDCVFAIANEPVMEGQPEGCVADDDPCIEMEEGSGLTWHGTVGARFSFNDTVQLRLGARLRFVEQVVDPGDSFLTAEGTLGLTFLLGGR